MTTLCTTISDMRPLVGTWRRAGESVGLVPTMGYLHEGHESLIKRSVAENDHTVVSIFVNPTQFGEGEDFESYPRDYDHDSALCQAAGVDAIFSPSSDVMYHPNHATGVHVEGLGDGLCGKSRPIHFDGVCLVVSKLLNIVSPQRAYFGQKDAQQLLIVRRMVRDLNFDTEIVACPIVREADGLAKSSRNTYLNKEERQAAVILSRALQQGHGLLEAGEHDAHAICTCIRDVLATESLANPEYVEIVDVDTVSPVERIEGSVLCAIAVRIGKTRLIDNFVFTPAASEVARS